MESKLLLALLIATLLAFSAGSDSDENGSDSGEAKMGAFGDSFEEQDDDCDRLVEGSDENDGKCDLTDGLEEVPDKCDKCDGGQKTKIMEWITSLKGLLKVKKSVEERLIEAQASMQKFQIDNPDCWELIQYKNISSWGYIASFTKVVQFRQSKKLEWLFTLDEEDNCPFFDGLFNNTDGSYEMESAVNALINGTLLDICKDGSLSITKKSVLIYEALTEFFAINSEWQSSFFQFKIEGFGTFQQCYEITKSYHQKTQVDIILEGEVSKCGFIVSFEKHLEMISTDMTISLTIKGNLKQFYNRIFQQLSKCAKGKCRLSIIITEMRAFIKLHPEMVEWLYGISIEKFGSFMELIYCGPWKIGFHPTTPMPSMSVSTISPKPTCSCTCGPTSFTTLMA